MTDRELAAEIGAAMYAAERASRDFIDEVVAMFRGRSSQIRGSVLPAGSA